MTDHTPPTEQQLAEYERLIADTTPLGAATASPGMAAALLAEIRRLRAGVASERPTEDHDGVYVDEQGFLYGEYQVSPRTDEVYLLRLQWVDEMAVAKSELEQQGAVFQHLGWCL